MAGSYNHIVGDDGKFCMDLIENLGDAHEALEECFDMIACLSGGKDENIERAHHHHLRTRVPHHAKECTLCTNVYSTKTEKEPSDAELIALAAAVNAQCTHIQAANMDRQTRGESMVCAGYVDDGELKELLAILKTRGRLA